MARSSRYTARETRVVGLATRWINVKSGSQILIVDDVPEGVELLEGRLRALGMRTSHVQNGAQALAAVRASPPDLVVLDVMMPELNGFQTCRAIKEERPELPVLMLTSRSEAADRFWATQCGADAFVSRPVDPVVVVQRIASLLGKP